MSISPAFARRLVGILILGLAAFGCGADLPTAPPAGPPTAQDNPELAARDLIRRLVGPIVGDGPSPASEWTLVGWGKVTSSGGVVSGSNYTLSFPPGAVAEPTQITISERDPDVIDVELGPHGTQFGATVTLTIDYRGTHADPLSPNWDGTLPLLFWFNDDLNLWVQLTGLNNILTRTYTVRLDHFSRYAFRTEGTAGWK